MHQGHEILVGRYVHLPFYRPRDCSLDLVTCFPQFLSIVLGVPQDNCVLVDSPVGPTVRDCKQIDNFTEVVLYVRGSSFGEYGFPRGKNFLTSEVDPENWTVG